MKASRHTADEEIHVESFGQKKIGRRKAADLESRECSAGNQ